MANGFLGGMGSAIGSGLEDNPYDRAIGTYKQFPGFAHGLMDPYLQMGRQALGGFEQQVGQNLQSPWGLQDRIMQHYHMSPGVQARMQAVTRANQNAAAATGSLGSPNQQLALQGRENQLIDQDQQQYYQNAMDPYHMAFGGLQFGVGEGQQGAEFGVQQGGDYLQNLSALQQQQTSFDNRGIGSGIQGVTSMGGGF